MLDQELISFPLVLTKVEIVPLINTPNKEPSTFPYLRVTVVVALIVILAIYLMLKYTRFGRSIYAVGGNQQSAPDGT